MNNYQNTLQRLYNLQKFSIKLRLSSITDLLKRLGQPQKKFKCIHIAGTNGKGSVGAMLEASLIAAKIKVGFFSSPHLINFTERFRLSGKEISKIDVINLAKNIWKVIDINTTPTFFEFITAMAFLYYARTEAELVILETGMGGRLDATNVCQPIITIITNISHEHKEYLGKTLASIAFEKAGIIKQNIPLIHGVTQSIARAVIEERAIKLKSQISRKGREITSYQYQNNKFDLNGIFWKLSSVSKVLIGRHQINNACLAFGAAENLASMGVSIKIKHFRQGLLKTSWPGRLEYYPPTTDTDPPIWLDGAHNFSAVKTLIDNLNEIRENRYPLIMIIGIMADKDISAMLNILVPAADKIIYSKPQYNRSANPNLLKSLAPDIKKRQDKIEPNLNQAIKQAKILAGPKGIILITGSLFTVGEARAILKRINISNKILN